MKFSIRDLLWFVLAVAILTGWVVNAEMARTHYAKRLQEARELDQATIECMEKTLQRIGDEGIVLREEIASLQEKLKAAKPSGD